MTIESHREARQRALQTLALAKWLKDSVADVITPLEKDAKQWLIENDMTPGTRLPAYVEDADVATISLTKGATERGFAVTDEEAYGNWLEANGFTDVWEERVRPHHTAASTLDALVERMEGELPDGLEYRVRERKPYITVRQTDTQAEALAEAVKVLATLQNVIYQITSGEDQE